MVLVLGHSVTKLPDAGLEDVTPSGSHSPPPPPFNSVLAAIYYPSADPASLDDGKYIRFT